MRLVITGGGTGGHLFPGIAVAEAVRQRIPGAEVLFIGTSRSIDQEILAESGMRTAELRCSGLKGASRADKVKSLLQLPAAVVSAVGLIRQFKADMVFGVGGYVTGPVLVGAKLLRLPVCIHEQNAIPGLANRLAGRLADVICTSIPCSGYFPAGRTVQTGNPIRRNILEASNKLRGGRREPTLLVLGGSQGAHAVNTLVVEAVQRMDHQGVGFSLIHQTGSADYEWVKSEYQKMAIDVTVQPFFKDMASLYSSADLAVSRAGATTLAELAVMGVPALFIPYPYAADLHQHANARYYTESGAGEILEQSELTGALLAEHVSALFQEPQRLEGMARKMKAQGIPEAAGRIVDQCIALL